MGVAWGAGPAGAGAHPEASPHRLRGRGRRRVPEVDEEAQEEEEKEPVPLPPQSDDTRVENMDISDEGEGPAAERGQRGWDEGPGGARGPGEDLSRQATSVSPPEEGGAPRSGSPEVLEEDEAELELQKQLEKGRRLRQLQQLRDSGEKVGGCGGRPGPRGRVGVWWPVLRSTCSCPFVCSTRVPLGSLSRFLLCCR